jgi:hypothetical protein
MNKDDHEIIGIFLVIVRPRAFLIGLRVRS